MTKSDIYLTIPGSIASMVGLILMILNDQTQSIIAMVCFVVFVISVAARIYFSLKKYFETIYPDGYLNLSIVVTYSSDDDRIYRYETSKLFQCKKIFMLIFPVRFKWSGKKEPIKIETTLKSVKSITNHDSPREYKVHRSDDEGNYDFVNVRLKKPLTYGEIETINVSMEFDDSNRKSIPFLETRVETPLKFLQHNIILKYKNADYTDKAVLKRKIMNSIRNVEYEDIDTVDFDQKTKTYSMTLIEPEPGYFYRLEWNR